MLLFLCPVGFHVLNLRAVAQHYHVELGGLQDGEVKGNGICRNIGYQIHAGYELRAKRTDHHRTDNVAGSVGEHRADEVGAGNAREANPAIAADGHTAHGVVAVSGVALGKGFLAAHNLVAVPVVTGILDVLQRYDGAVGFLGLRRVAAPAGIVLAVQIVVHTLEPAVGLIHHPVALRTVQLSR